MSWAFAPHARTRTRAAAHAPRFITAAVAMRMLCLLLLLGRWSAAGGSPRGMAPTGAVETVSVPRSIPASLTPAPGFARGFALREGEIPYLFDQDFVDEDEGATTMARMPGGDRPVIAGGDLEVAGR